MSLSWITRFAEPWSVASAPSARSHGPQMCIQGPALSNSVCPTNRPVGPADGSSQLYPSGRPPLSVSSPVHPAATNATAATHHILLILITEPPNRSHG